MYKLKAARFAPLLASLVAAPAGAQYGAGSPYYGYGPGMMWGGGWVGPFFGLFMMAVAFAILVGLTVAVIRWLVGLGGNHVSPPSKSTPLDILKERFARGEIDKDEFEERKRHLMS